MGESDLATMIPRESGGGETEREESRLSASNLSELVMSVETPKRVRRRTIVQVRSVLGLPLCVGQADIGTKSDSREAMPTPNEAHERGPPSRYYLIRGGGE